MAFVNNFNGITFDNQPLTAESDSFIQNSKRKDNGVIKDVGDELSFVLAALEVTVNTGLLVEQGRSIRNDTSTIDISLAAGANEFGYVLVKIDLSQAAGSQVGFVTKQQVGSLPTLQQDDLKANPATGIVEIPILSYEVSSASVVSTTDQRVFLDDVAMGNVTDLVTTSKEIVGAINELDAKFDSVYGEIVASGIGFSGSANDLIVDIGAIGNGYYEFIAYNFTNALNLQIDFGAGSTGRTLKADATPTSRTNLVMRSTIGNDSTALINPKIFVQPTNIFGVQDLIDSSTLTGATFQTQLLNTSVGTRAIYLDADYLVGTIDWILVKLHD